MKSGLAVVSCLIGVSWSCANGEGQTSTDGGPPCATGTKDCPCYGNQTCDAGLACVAGACRTQTGDPDHHSDPVVGGDPHGGDPSHVGDSLAGGDACTPNCAGRNCGSNGCGGSCGTCSWGVCSGVGQCPVCTDTCIVGTSPDYCSETTVMSCGQFNADTCAEYGALETCPEVCNAGLCVDCNLSSDCPDPIKERCTYATHACDPAPQWADTTIVYDNTATQHLTNCYYCDAIYTATSSSGLLRFQQGGGLTIWSLYLYPTLTVGTQALSTTLGTGAYVFLAESDTSLPARYRSTYSTTGGTITIVQLDLRNGGKVSGTVNAILHGGNDSPPFNATLTAPFYAEFPP